MSDQYSVVPLSHLRHGTKITSAIYDGNDDSGKLMLLSAGTTITPSLLSRLKRRGIEKVRVNNADLNTAVTVADQEKLAALHKRFRETRQYTSNRNRISKALKGTRITAESFLQQLHDPFQISFSEYVIEEFSKQHSASLDHVDTMIDSLLKSEMS